MSGLTPQEAYDRLIKENRWYFNEEGILCRCAWKCQPEESPEFKINKPVYIVCQKKRNNPRMDIRICEKKCELKDECSAYQAVKKENQDIITK